MLCTGGGPTSLTLLFWQWLTVSSIFICRIARSSYSSLSFPVPNMSYVDVKNQVYSLTYYPLAPSLIRHTLYVNVKHHEKKRKKKIIQNGRG